MNMVSNLLVSVIEDWFFYCDDMSSYAVDMRLGCLEKFACVLDRYTKSA